MLNDENPILIYSTFPSAQAAEIAGKALVEARLAACVNILPSMTSIYEWEGTLERAQESVMIIKTVSSLRDDVIEEAKRLHPYDTPALLVLRVDGGYRGFLEWLAAQTGKKTP